jgi:hypothetical protein
MRYCISAYNYRYLQTHITNDISHHNGASSPNKPLYDLGLYFIHYGDQSAWGVGHGVPHWHRCHASRFQRSSQTAFGTSDEH